MKNKEKMKRILKAQKREISEYFIYKKLSQATKDPHNSKVLAHIAQDELRHYDFLKRFTGKEQKPYWTLVLWYYLVSKIFGLTFGIKLMERGEGQAKDNYGDLSKSIPEALDIVRDKDGHEVKLIGMINEERLQYVGSIILGLNDALVELSGALAGFTLALQNSRLVAVVGLITGIAAALSMGSTGYLASKSEEDGKAPLKSALYTGISYIATVLFLVFPYLVFSNVFLALGIMILNALIIIMVFNFYISVAKGLSFLRKFSEMALLSLGIATISFGIGFLVRELLGVEF